MFRTGFNKYWAENETVYSLIAMKRIAISCNDSHCNLQFLRLSSLQVLQYIANIAIKMYCNYCNMSEIREIYCRDSITIIAIIVIYWNCNNCNLLQWSPLQFLPLFLLQVLQYIANIASENFRKGLSSDSAWESAAIKFNRCNLGKQRGLWNIRGH